MYSDSRLFGTDLGFVHGARVSGRSAAVFLQRRTTFVLAIFMADQGRNKDESQKTCDQDDAVLCDRTGHGDSFGERQSPARRDEPCWVDTALAVKKVPHHRLAMGRGVSWCDTDQVLEQT